MNDIVFANAIHNGSVVGVGLQPFKGDGEWLLVSRFKRKFSSKILHSIKL